MHLVQLLDAQPQAAHARLLVRTWKQRKHVPQHLADPILGDAQVCTVQPIDETDTGVKARCVKQRRDALALPDLSFHKFPVVQLLGAPAGCSDVSLMEDGVAVHFQQMPCSSLGWGELEMVFVHLPVPRQLHEESPILQRLYCSPSSLGVSGRHGPRLDGTLATSSRINGSSTTPTRT